MHDIHNTHKVDTLRDVSHYSVYPITGMNLTVTETDTIDKFKLFVALCKIKVVGDVLDV